MSLHGVQKRLPFNINSNTNQELPLNCTLAANFATISDRIAENEKLVSFSEVMWPYMFIQAEPNHHLMIDDVGLSNLSLKLTSAPRTAQVGNVLRDPNMDKIDKLKLIQRILKFEENVQLENEEEETSSSEFQVQEINSLVNPKLLAGFVKIIPTVIEFQMEEFNSLESSFSFDDALGFAESFIAALDLTHGNAIRWDSTRKLMEEPVEKWKTELVVKIKDTEEIYKGNLQTANAIDDQSIENTLDSAKDNADQWVVREQKNIIGKIGKLFVGVDLIFEDLRKHDRYFIDTESLKNNDINTVIKKAFQHVANLHTSLEDCSQKAQEISEKLNLIRQEVEDTSLSAEDRIQKLNADLMDQKQVQENRIQELERERDSVISRFQELSEEIDRLYESCINMITQKIEDCKFDSASLQQWEMSDENCQITNPTIRYFIPVGIGLIKDEDDEERIEVVFPRIISENLSQEPLCNEFPAFEKEITKKLDKNMKIRSNFEFTIEKRNIKNDEFDEGRCAKRV